MPISNTTRRVLNTLGRFESGLAANRNGGRAVLLGDFVAQSLAGGDFKIALAAGVTPAVAPNATDLATAQALANELKTKVNQMVTIFNAAL